MLLNEPSRQARILAICWIALYASVSCHFSQALESHSEGSCVEYPDDGWCSEFGFSGQTIFQWDNTSIAYLDAYIDARYSAIRQSISSIASNDCITHFYRIICLGYFPLCDSSTGVPRRPCASYCEDVHDNYCTAAFGKFALELVVK